MVGQRPESDPQPEEDAAAAEAADLLRVRASVRLKGEELLTPELSVWETAKLIQELRVHQIELEMQNEELRRAQAELEASRSRYADLYDFAPVGYLVLDKNGVVAGANLAGDLLLGVERAHLIGKPFRLYIRPDNQDHFHRYRRLLRESGLRQGRELILIRKDETEVAVQLSGEVIKHEGAERDHVRMALTDISERKEAQEKIANLARFPSENPSPVLRLSTDGRILYANGAAADLLRHWHLGEGQRAPAIWCKVAEEIRRSGRPGVREVRLEDRVFSFLFASIPKAGYVNLYGRDITQQRRVEKTLRKHQDHLEELVQARTQELSEANTRLLGEIEQRERLQAQILRVCENEQRRIGQELHDTIGQEFTGIGYLLKGFEGKFLKEAPEARASLDGIRELLSGALTKIKNLARGLHPVDLETMGLAASLEGLAARAEHLYGVSCVVDLDESVPAGDSDVTIQLYRIAREALTNAVKHGEAKCIRITLALQDGAGLLRVRNDGRPFPSEPRTDQGMGLHLMRYRAETIGGRFDIRAGQTDGTVVTCTFPIPVTGNGEESRAGGAPDAEEKEPPTSRSV